MNRADNMCRNAGLTEARKKGRCRGPDDIDHRAHVGAGPLKVALPIRHHFVQIKNRLIVAETELIKQGNVESKLFPNEDLVVSPHRNDEVGSLDQLLGELSLDVSGWINAFLAQPGLDPSMHGLRLGVNPGRADDAGHAGTILALSAYSAVTLRKMFPVHTNRTDSSFPLDRFSSFPMMPPAEDRQPHG